MENEVTLEEAQKTLDDFGHAVKEASSILQSVLTAMPQSSEMVSAIHYLQVSLMFLERAFNGTDAAIMKKHIDRQTRRHNAQHSKDQSDEQASRDN